jgi:DNA-binding transcriptional MerR regulator
MISDAAKLVDVETHVLRYWEEELELNIFRNEMGHRYYTKEDINLFRNIKVIKEKGFQLKAVKALVPQLSQCDASQLHDLIPIRAEELSFNVFEENKTNGDELEKEKNKKEEINRDEINNEEKAITISTKREVGSVTDDKMQQFQSIIKEIVSEALLENNYELGKEVSGRVSDSVLKEMDYLMKVQDEREEERFKKLDELMRSRQKSRKEIAITKEAGKKKKKFKLL